MSTFFKAEEEMVKICRAETEIVLGAQVLQFHSPAARTLSLGKFSIQGVA
jgi:hypothetical protein